MQLTVGWGTGTAAILGTGSRDQLTETETARSVSERAAHLEFHRAHPFSAEEVAERVKRHMTIAEWI